MYVVKKRVVQYCDYLLPEHLYISPRITSIKQSTSVLTKTSMFVLFSPYDSKYLQFIST